MVDRIIGVIMPANPPIDKVAALAVLEMYQGCEVKEIAFWDKPACPKEQLNAWREEGIFPVDLGEEKYQKGSSATEVVAKQLYGADIPEPVRALIAELNKNNGDGSLKGRALSIALTIRDAYDLKNEEGWAETLVREGVEVVKAWLAQWANYGQYAECVSALEEQVLEREFPQLLAEMWRQLQGRKDLKLGFSTLLQYLRDLQRAGRPRAEIEERVGFWLKAKSNFLALLPGYQKQIRDIEAGHLGSLTREDERVFSIPGGIRALSLVSPHPVLVKLATQSHKWEVVVIKEADGRGCVITRNLNISRLVRALQEQEPGIWYDSGHGVVMNGGKMYKGVQPTALTMHDLQWMLGEYPPERKKPAVATGKYK
jgi:hypothetical protein